MITEILSTILSALFCVSGIVLLVWYIFYTTKSEFAKRNIELEEELNNLKIVNSNLAKYNYSLLELIKK